MSRQTTSNDYHERINKVLEYINNHLDESLDLAVLAEQSSFSKFHFHRIMKSYLHEPLGSYVIRLRLELAARLLRYTSEPVNTIAYSCGYETPSSFNKAFKKNFNLSPLEFRKKNGSFTTENIYTKSAPQDSFKMPQPKIKHVKEKKMIYIKTNGYSDEAIGPAWEKLVRFMKKQKLFSIFFEAIGISYDDPHITDRSKCRYDACAVVKKR